MQKMTITKWGEFCAKVRRLNITEQEQRNIIDAAGEACMCALKDGFNKSIDTLTKKYKQDDQQ